MVSFSLGLTFKFIKGSLHIKEPLTPIFSLNGHKENYLLLLPSLKTFSFEMSWLPTLATSVLFLSL
jgi:hypothetical protein